MARALIHMPATARKGEVIEIRALIGQHPLMTTLRQAQQAAVEPGFVNQLRFLDRDKSCLLYTSPSPRDS